MDRLRLAWLGFAGKILKPGRSYDSALGRWAETYAGRVSFVSLNGIGVPMIFIVVVCGHNEKFLLDGVLFFWTSKRLPREVVLSKGNR